MPPMSAVMLDGWDGDLEQRTVPNPDPGPGEVRVEVQACGVTRTVHNAIQGGFTDDPDRLPRIPGHEFSGIVESVGDGVTGFEPGDRVFAYFYLVCGHCDACLRGDANQCANFDGWLGISTDGAYAEYATVPATNLLQLPETASFVDGAMAADGLSTPLHICEQSDVDDTDTIAVIGSAGRIGTQLTQIAAMRGAHVLAIDVTDDRLDAIDDLARRRRIGTQVDAIDGRNGLSKQLLESTRTGDGPTVVVDAVGDTETLGECWDALAMGGEVVSLTTHHDRMFAPPLKEFVAKDATLRGARYATKAEVRRAARLLGDGRIEAPVTQTIGLSEVPDVHRQFETGDTSGMTILEP